MDDEAALVAVLGRRHAGDQLHRLHGVGRDLVRVHAALLIGDRLVVDRKLRLRVIANRMEKAVRIGDDAGRGERDDLIEPGLRLDRHLVDAARVDVGVRRRIVLEQIFGVADDADRFGHANLEREIEGDRHGRPHVDVALERLEALCVRGDVVRVRRQITEHELSCRIGGGSTGQPRDRIGQLHLDGLHHPAGRIFDGSLDGSGAAKLLPAGGRRDAQRQNPDKCHTKTNVHRTSFPIQLIDAIKAGSRTR